MQIELTPLYGPADALIIGVYEGGESVENIAEPLRAQIDFMLHLGDFAAKSNQIAVHYPAAGDLTRVLLLGLGAKEKLDAEAVRRAIASALKRAAALKTTRAVLDLPIVQSLAFGQAIAEGALLGTYKFHGQKSSPKAEPYPKTLAVIGTDEDFAEGLRVGQIIAEATNAARELVAQPPNICTPNHMADTARKAAALAGLHVEVLEKHQIEALKMGAFLAVARGSELPPRFIILEHNAEQAEQLPTIVLVGKGITFDTGGYSIKTTEGLVGMKDDMAGGAAVIYALQVAGLLKLPLHVVGLVPTCDNRINDKAFVPDEVLTASNGLTIEITSTDAEGRLILADALAFAARYKPAAVVNIATLTGSMTIALGAVAAGCYSNDDALSARLIAAGAATHERLWPMPIYPEHDKLLESKTADMKNTGGRYGGANIAAAFLRKFVSYPAWAHLDIAGTARLDSSESAYVPAGTTGFGVRLFTELLQAWPSDVARG
jgi:leucyl aminopeptidase